MDECPYNKKCVSEKFICEHMEKTNETDYRCDLSEEVDNKSSNNSLLELLDYLDGLEKETMKGSKCPVCRKRGYLSEDWEECEHGVWTKCSNCGARWFDDWVNTFPITFDEEIHKKYLASQYLEKERKKKERKKVSL